jgi:hypothetical protein
MSRRASADDVQASFSSGFVSELKQMLDLQGLEEAFHQCVSQQLALPFIDCRMSWDREQLAVLRAGVLATTIGMQNHVGAFLPLKSCSSVLAFRSFLMSLEGWVGLPGLTSSRQYCAQPSRAP